MSLFIGSSTTNVKATGTTTTVPNNDVNKLSYYLFCGTKACGVDIIVDELVDYKNVHKLPSKRQDAIFFLAYHTFDLETLVNKTIFYDDDNKVLPRKVMNEFYDLEHVQTCLAVQESVMIGGQQKQVRKIMVFNKKWIMTYYVDPLKRNESRLRRISAEKAKTSSLTVEEAISGLLHLLINNDTTDRTKHCDHCQGSDSVCKCEHGCPSKDESKCRVVHTTITCDLCFTQGIQGTRYKCRECYNFDLCENCYEHGDHARGTHSFSRSARVGSKPVYIQPKNMLPTSAPPTTTPRQAYVATPVTPDSRSKNDPEIAIPIVDAVVSPNFQAGQTVRVKGLVQKPEWNGRTVLVKYDRGDGTVIVTFPDDGKNLTVKTANLEPVNECGIPVGSMVEIHGIAMDLTLNGEVGVVVDIANGTTSPDRVRVQLLNNESRILSLKPDNLRIVEDLA